MADMFSISWDPQSLKEIAQLIGFAGLLSPVIQQALRQGGESIVKVAQDNTWARFRNPTGALSESLHVLEQSPYELEIGSDLSYSRRREYGFSGMTDSLNRFYPSDPGVLYLTDALASQQDEVLAFLQQGIEGMLGGSGQ